MNKGRLRRIRGLKVGSPDDLALALEHAVGLKFRRATYLTGGQVAMTFDFQGKHVQFTARIEEVLSGDLPDYPRGGGGEESLPCRRHSRGLTYDELVEHGLPLYWDREWLLAELNRLGTYKRVALEHGYNYSSVAKFARGVHGIRLTGRTRSVVSDREMAVRTLLDDQPDISPAEVARVTGIPVTSAWRYARRAMAPDAS